MLGCLFVDMWFLYCALGRYFWISNAAFSQIAEPWFFIPAVELTLFAFYANFSSFLRMLRHRFIMVLFRSSGSSRRKRGFKRLRCAHKRFAFTRVSAP
jgi:hypothetical protein